MFSIPSKRPPKRVLVVATPGFGDVLLATPLFRSIKREYPDAAIDVIVIAGREEMLVGNADVRNTIPIPKRPTALQLLRLCARIIGRYQLAISPMGSDRLVSFARIASRRCVAMLDATATKERWKRWAVTAWVPRDADQQQVLRHMNIADALGIERACEIVPPFDAAAPALLDEHVPFDWRTEPYAVLHPSTHATRKRWTLDGWQTLGKRLVDRGWKCVITGGPNEEPGYIESILAAIGPDALSLAGQLPMTAVRELIEHSRIFVGVDTSTAHLAAAVGTPTVALYGPGPTNRFALWPHGYESNEPPFRNVLGAATNGNVCIIQGDCPCGKDYPSGCGTEMPGRSRCLEELATDSVVSAVEQLLKTRATDA
jgi:heptosyltransferase-3